MQIWQLWGFLTNDTERLNIAIVYIPVTPASLTKCRRRFKRRYKSYRRGIANMMASCSLVRVAFGEDDNDIREICTREKYCRKPILAPTWEASGSAHLLMSANW
jgi:hypothetical protein